MRKMRAIREQERKLEEEEEPAGYWLSSKTIHTYIAF
jgi:hypothetical protein